MEEDDEEPFDFEVVVNEDDDDNLEALQLLEDMIAADMATIEEYASSPGKDENTGGVSEVSDADGMNIDQQGPFSDMDVDGDRVDEDKDCVSAADKDEDQVDEEQMEDKMNEDEDRMEEDQIEDDDQKHERMRIEEGQRKKELREQEREAWRQAARYSPYNAMSTKRRTASTAFSSARQHIGGVRFS